MFKNNDYKQGRHPVFLFYFFFLFLEHISFTYRRAYKAIRGNNGPQYLLYQEIFKQNN